MMHNSIKRFLAVLLAAIVLSCLIPMQVLAATTVTVLDGKVSITDSATSMSESGGTVTVTAKGGLFSQTTNTITIYNKTDAKAKLTFNYSANNYKSFSESSASGTYSVDLDAGASVTMSITGKGSISNNTATLTLSNFSLVAISASSNITFSYDSTYGSITVGGSAVASGGVVNIASSGSALVATAASGAQFLGWINTADGSILSSSTSYTLTPATDMSVKAVFVGANSAPWFGIGIGAKQTQKYGFLDMSSFNYYTVASYTHLFDNLTDAITAATSGTSKYIVLANSGTLAAGTYTIPSGVTLLIPYDASNTCYTTNAQWGGETMAAPTAYRTLTMASGAKLIIEGSMSVSGKHAYTNSGGQSGSPTGELGFVRMQSGSEITVKGGLYAWGYIIGSGTVTAKSGAKVYEVMQMPEFRGGSQSTSMDNKVFPLSQFYIQNIEVPLTLEAGALEYAYSTLYASRSYFETGACLFGSSSTNGMFNITSGSITKHYDGTTDRTTIVANGAIQVSSIDLQVDTSSINSQSYVLPINGGFTIHLKSGSSLTIPSTQDVLLQPNAQVIIEQNASVTVNSKLYIYDAAQWGAFSNWGHAGAGDANCWDTPVIPVSYSPTRTKVRLHVFPRGLFTDSAGNAVYMTEDPDIYEAIFGKNAGDLIAEADLAEFLTLLPDASILVNGTLTGNIYTTADGANIYSSGTGTFTQTATENASVYQLMMGSDYSFNSDNAEYYVEASATPAQLKNSDGSYISSTATTFNYDSASGKWLCATHTGVDPDHICDVCGFTTECVDEVPEGETYADHKCDICGKTLTECADSDDEDSLCDICGVSLCAHANTEVQNKADATCTKDGYTGDKVCTSCGATIETGTTIESAGHSYTSKVTQAATCAAKGVTTYTCSVCGDSYTEAIDKIPHSYDTGTVTTAPSCTATGTMTYTCSECAGTKTDTIAATGHTPGEAATCTEAQTCTVCSTVIEAALGHNAVTDDAVAPTCTATGLSEGSHCDRCGEVLAAQTVVPATGHSYEAVVTQPTCTEEGFTTYTCSCGDSKVDDKVAAVGHNYKTEVTAPTCTEQGYTTHTCSVCGDTYKDNYKDATGHSYEAVVTQPTCTAQGYTTYTCSCGDTYNDSYVAATGHNWNEGEITTAPSCESEGVKTYTCSSCSGTKTETIAATGHSWNEGVITTAPGCESEGVKTYTCSSCSETKTEAVSATGHTSEDVEYKAPTCTELGHEAGQKCSICNAVLSGMTEIAATGHNHEAKVTAPTCTADGYTTYTCACGDGYTGDPVAATGHSYTSKVTDPTCTEEGYTTYTCSVCSDTYTDDVVAAVGHSYVEKVTAPTCEDQGYTTHTCSACGDSYVDTYVDPTGHSYEYYVSNNDASCTEDGTKTAKCDNGCGMSDTITDTGSATGHKYEQNIASNKLFQEATCTTPAMYYVACDICKTPHEQQTVAVGEPKGHSYVNHKAQAPSCTEIGWNAYQTCNNCDYTSYVEITALGHTAGDVVVENEVAADCTNDGSHDNVTYCTLCGVETSRETIEVPATGHTAGDVVVENEVAADCVTGGSYDNVTYCTVCGVETSRETITADALGHTEGEIVVENNVAADCTNAGSYDNVTYCTVCGEETSRETVTVDALGHSYEAVVTAPTCTAKGYTTYTCACGDTYTDDEVAALGHSYSSEVTTPATCTAAGVKTYTCACSDSYTEEIAATGHGNTTTTTVDATCVDAGSVTVTCDDCGTTLSTEIISATGEHSYGEDGKCTVCGVYAPIIERITLKGAQLELASEVYMYINSAFSNEEGYTDDYLVANMGLLMWPEAAYPGADAAIYENCELIVSDVSISGQIISTKSIGIPAKELGDEYYMRVYLRMEDGTFVYSRVTNPYSPQKYAEDRLKNSSNEYLKKAVVAMLDYGAAAQVYFDHRTEDLANNIVVSGVNLDDYRTAFSSELLVSTIAADSSVIGDLSRNKTDCPTITPQLELVGKVNYQFTFKFTSSIMQNAVSGKAMFWSEDAYNKIKASYGQFSEENATLIVEMQKNSAGYYVASYDQTAVKDLAKTVYVCGFVSDSAGNTWNSGIAPYSAHAYASDRIANGSANIQALVKGMVVFGNCALNYFNNR